MAKWDDATATWDSLTALWDSGAVTPPEALSELEAIFCAASIEVDFGLELLTTADVLTEDISDDLQDGEIEFHADALIGGTATFKLARELDWADVRVRPYQTVTVTIDGTETTRTTNLGIYCPVEPDANLGGSPVTYDVTAYDKLSYLDRPIGDTYQVNASTDVITAVKALITASGMTGVTYDIDTSAPVTTTEALVWVLDSNATTYLTAINDLLASASYVPLWVDYEGRFCTAPIVSTASLPSVWTFDLADARTQLVEEDRTLSRSEYDRTNWWRFINTNVDAPSEGAGFYTVDNSDSGTKYCQVLFEAKDSQTELEAWGTKTVEEAGQVKVSLTISTSPLPLLAEWGRLPVVDYTDNEAGGPLRAQVAWYRIPLDGANTEVGLEVV